MGGGDDTVSVVRKIVCDIAQIEAGPDTALFESGLVDSFRTLEIIKAIEDKFGIEVDPFDLTEEDLASVRAIAAFVDRKAA